MNLRQLTTSDAAAFQRLRLFGLQESPSAFGSSHEEEESRTIEQVQIHLVGSHDRVFFGAFQGSELIGVIGVGREQGAKERHLAFIRSMYVAPNARGQGVGRQLLLTALERALCWQGVEQVTLAVTATNGPAISLYRSVGFIETGRHPRALRLGSEYFDEVSMVRFCSPAA
ncbi:MAG: N-acetyltransferase family protein [Betaproteobacteria bacterium]